MKRSIIALFGLLFCANTIIAQNDVKIDGRLKPHLDKFFEYCKEYNIQYYDKLFKLKNIDIVDTLTVSSKGSTLGMLTRDKNNNVENIIINWITMLDPEILKVVAFHEFAHYFLEYQKHICDDCNQIMAVVNTSYFDIIKDWDNQVKTLFLDSPAYKTRKTVAYIEPYNTKNTIAN
ncbi:hypothetical protein J8L88_10135 [Aquimarina sp. MMG015]|uniref:hypothetical protein n=1 Tax=Aquimarina TaxID=290174 RepID=UPI00041DACCC|nr:MULTISPECIES: hypothetical protein [Aquimarina]AXT57851.1 hypothetical protein D1815_19600 [Aquimarina sp. AD1]MBQ4803206.1 hypothetical protein [Aquimarina sp. MMG015]RKN34990.1 hypothetical protein D7035_03640 [Aquimarina sp. AD1]